MDALVQRPEFTGAPAATLAGHRNVLHERTIFDNILSTGNPPNPSHSTPDYDLAADASALVLTMRDSTIAPYIDDVSGPPYPAVGYADYSALDSQGGQTYWSTFSYGTERTTSIYILVGVDNLFAYGARVDLNQVNAGWLVLDDGSNAGLRPTTATLYALVGVDQPNTPDPVSGDYIQFEPGDAQRVGWVELDSQVRSVYAANYDLTDVTQGLAHVEWQATDVSAGNVPTETQYDFVVLPEGANPVYHDRLGSAAFWPDAGDFTVGTVLATVVAPNLGTPVFTDEVISLSSISASRASWWAYWRMPGSRPSDVLSFARDYANPPTVGPFQPGSSGGETNSYTEGGEIGFNPTFVAPIRVTARYRPPKFRYWAPTFLSGNTKTGRIAYD
jgi:hypothetical protein